MNGWIISIIFVSAHSRAISTVNRTIDIRALCCHFFLWFVSFFALCEIEKKKANLFVIVVVVVVGLLELRMCNNLHKKSFTHVAYIKTEIENTNHKNITKIIESTKTKPLFLIHLAFGMSWAKRVA